MSEKMNKEQAQKILQERKYDFCDCFIECDDRDCELIQALDIVIESLDNEWVDVRDRLPSEKGVYLVTIDFSPPSIQVYEVSYGYSRELEKECFYDYDDGWGEREVTDVIAWKPLPQPYERKE